MIKKNIFIVPLMIMGLFLTIITGCKKDDEKNAPKVTTVVATEITTSTAVSGGSIIKDGGADIIASGVCWSTSANPTLMDNKTINGVDIGDFTSNITGLKFSTTYYVRAYATNSVGTAYGQAISFTTSKPVALLFIDSSDDDYPPMVKEALETQGYLVHTSTKDDLDTDLTSDGYNLVVFLAQSNGAGDYTSVTSIENYINNGTLMIYTSWDTDDSDFAALFDASYSGKTNLTEISITDTDIANIAGFSSFTISNVGWGTFSTGLTATGSGVTLASYSNGDAAMVLGNSGHTIMIGYLADAPAESSRQLIFESLIAKVSEAF